VNGCERSVDVIHLLFFLFGGRNGTKMNGGCQVQIGKVCGF